MKVNLHMHTTYSDGRLDVKQLIKTMQENMFDLIAITDHDRIDGVKEALKLPITRMKIITGIEISSNNHGIIPFLSNRHSLHILGLGYDVNLLDQFYKERQLKKTSLAVQLYHKLIEDGYHLGNIDFNAINSTIIAELLVQSHHAQNVDDVFQRIIIPKYSEFRLSNLNIKDVIQLIHDAKGYAIWAHPFEILKDSTKEKTTQSEIIAITEILMKLGIDGLESNYAKYTDEERKFLVSLTEKYNLLSSYGSDFHGKTNEEWLYLNEKCLNVPNTDSLISKLI